VIYPTRIRATTARGESAGGSGFAVRVFAARSSTKTLSGMLGLALTFNHPAGIDYEAGISHNDKSGGTTWTWY
jgi:hypothetical protein